LSGGGGDAIRMTIRLVQCDEAGEPVVPLGTLPPALADNCRGSADLYRRVGFEAPWVSYVALDGDAAVGGGAFVGPPREGRVEIAYFTLPGLEGRGYATGTATALCRIARAADPNLLLTAFTLPETNASTAILARLGFRVFGTAVDPDAGEVWEWRMGGDEEMDDP
jgi:RimJ/RimL family protein N-acetyltransferase